MPAARSLKTWLLAIILVSPVALGSQKRPPRNQRSPQENGQHFQKLLDQVPEENLHEALHSLHPAFKDGIFEGDRPAAEAVHDEDPALASHVVTTAAQMKNLRKRQIDNTTSTSNSPSSYNPPTHTPSSYSPPSLTPNPTTPSGSKPSSSSKDLPPYPEPTPSDDSSNSGGSEPSQGSSGGGSENRPPPSHPKGYSSPPNVVVPFSRTTTDDNGRHITTSTSVPGLVFHTTDAEGNERATTSPLPTAGPVISGKGNHRGGSDVTTTDRYGNTITLTGAAAGDVFTITDAEGKVITTTYRGAGGGAGAVRSLVLHTETLPNGERSTLTSVAVIVPTVEPGNTPTAGGKEATGTSPAPGLVSGNAGVVSRKVGKEAVALVAGAAGVAWLL